MSSPVRRQAIIIANSVAPQLTQPAFRGGVVLRTAQQVGRALEHLPGDYPFDVDLVVDMTAAKARSRVARGSEDCAKSRGLLLVYYFGHARLQGDDVAFAHPSGKKGDRDFLPFEQLLTAISYGGATKVLIILDCCYAGAGAFALARRDFRYCLMACTTDSSRAWYNDNIERPPIGYFTESILDGLSNQEAAVSATNDSINVMTLFRFAQRITKEKTDGRQDAVLIGTLDETLTEYSPVPVIISGVTTDAPAKSGYCKLLAVVSALGKSRVDTVQELHRRVLHKYREAFMTPFKEPDGRITERPVQAGVLRRYVSFLRAVGAVDDEEIMLTVSGMQLTADHRRSYNERLLRLLDLYLSRFGLTREAVRTTMQKILERRSLTTRVNVLTDLARISRLPLDQGKVGMLMDLLGHIGAIGMPRRREQVYFPWSGPTPRSRGR